MARQSKAMTAPTRRLWPPLPARPSWPRWDSRLTFREAQLGGFLQGSRAGVGT